MWESWSIMTFVEMPHGWPSIPVMVGWLHLLLDMSGMDKEAPIILKIAHFYRSFAIISFTTCISPSNQLTNKSTADTERCHISLSFHIIYRQASCQEDTIAKINIWRSCFPTPHSGRGQLSISDLYHFNHPTQHQYLAIFTNMRYCTLKIYHVLMTQRHYICVRCEICELNCRKIVNFSHFLCIWAS